MKKFAMDTETSNGIQIIGEPGDDALLYAHLREAMLEVEKDFLMNALLDPHSISTHQRQVGMSAALGAAYGLNRNTIRDEVLELKLGKKTYKRFGDMARDMDSGEMIPLRSLSAAVRKEIK